MRIERIYNFTHGDLDGVGCPILLTAAEDFTDGREVLSKSCGFQGNNEINLVINNFLDEMGLDDEISEIPEIWITDIGVNERTAERLDDLCKQGYILLYLFDHHVTNEWLNKYSWAHVTLEIDGRPTCATEILYKWLLDNWECEALKIYKDFVEVVLYRDTAMWITRKNDPTANRHAIRLSYYLNEVFYMRRWQQFISDIFSFHLNHLEDIDRGFDLFDIIAPSEYQVISKKREDYDAYKNTKIAEVVTMPLPPMVTEIGCYGANRPFGLVFADHDVSELGNDICNALTDIDFIAMINLNRKSVELRCVKDGVDVSTVAKLLGGGGHKKAAGFSLTPEMMSSALSSFGRNFIEAMKK